MFISVSMPKIKLVKTIITNKSNCFTKIYFFFSLFPAFHLHGSSKEKEKNLLQFTSKKRPEVKCAVKHVQCAVCMAASSIKYAVCSVKRVVCSMQFEVCSV